MTDEQIRDAYLEHGSQQRAADALGITRKALRCALARLKRAAERTLPQTDTRRIEQEYPPEALDAAMREIADQQQIEMLNLIEQLDGSLHRAAKELGRKPAEIKREVDRLKIRVAETYTAPHRDPEKVALGYRNKGFSTMRRIWDPASQEWVIQWHKTERDPNALAYDPEVLSAALSSIEGLARALPTPAEHASADLLNCLPIGDPHFGMYAWGLETGQQDFDLKIAERQWRTMADNAVAVMPHTEQGVMIQLGDLTHGNDHKNVTPQSGHHLDVDTRHALVMMAAHRCMVYAAERMRERCRSLRIVSIGGNHSPDAVIALNIALDAYFRHVPEVEVDMSVRDIRHVISFGDVLITASHGDKQKPEALGALVPAHYPAEWGSSVHRYHHGGHVHHTHRRDIGGLVFESHRSPAPMDAYAAAKFWSQQSVSAIVYHRRLGERRRFTIGIE